MDLFSGMANGCSLPFSVKLTNTGFFYGKENVISSFEPLLKMGRAACGGHILNRRILSNSSSTE
jgi:hypothetical protein